MFYNRPDCITIREGIYVFKNYIPQNMQDKYISLFESYPVESFKEEGLNNHDWYADHMSPHINELIDIWEHVSELIYPDYFINPQAQVISSRPGQEGMFVHCDSPGKGRSDLLHNDDSFGTCSLIDYGVVAYLGDFTGGEVFYPSFLSNGELKLDGSSSPSSDDLMYKPESGDVVIHSAYAPYYHGTKPVLSGIRYAFSCFATHADETPGTFYNYKSPEYLEKVKDRSEESLKNWCFPINA